MACYNWLYLLVSLVAQQNSSNLRISIMPLLRIGIYFLRICEQARSNHINNVNLKFGCDELFIECIL